MISKEKSIFDTISDTRRIFVTARHRFSLRKYADKDGNSILYLDVSDKTDRIRLKTDVYIPASCWNQKKQRIVGHPQADSLNLILDNIIAKLTAVKTNYMLRNLPLSAKSLIDEFQSNTPDFDFISFFSHHIELNKVNFEKQTVKNQMTILNKLKAFRNHIPFHKIDADLFLKYRKFYSHNSEITFNSDLKTIKKYLKIAVKKGYHINMDLDDLKVNVDSKNFFYLLPFQVKNLIEYYFSEDIPENQRKPLGYFLIACYTGMRVSDVRERKRAELLGSVFQFTHWKTDNFQSMKLNDDAKKILLHEPKLFTEKFIEQTVNRELKNIANACGIAGKLSMHTARHTFATTVYRNTRDILLTKKLLGHSNIKHTLTYVHVVEGEELDVMDRITY